MKSTKNKYCASQLRFNQTKNNKYINLHYFFIINKILKSHRIMKVRFNIYRFSPWIIWWGRKVCPTSFWPLYKMIMINLLNLKATIISFVIRFKIKLQCNICHLPFTFLFCRHLPFLV